MIAATTYVCFILYQEKGRMLRYFFIVFFLRIIRVTAPANEQSPNSAIGITEE